MHLQDTKKNAEEHRVPVSVELVKNAIVDNAYLLDIIYNDKQAPLKLEEIKNNVLESLECLHEFMRSR